MTRTANIDVTTYDGGKWPAESIAIRAEMTNDGKVFYHTEIQGSHGSRAVSFIYDLDEALAEFNTVARELLTKQTAQLKINRGIEKWKQ